MDFFQQKLKTMLRFALLLISLVAAYSNKYRLEKLESYSSPIIQLDGKTFSVLTESPRNYTIYVHLLTTLAEHNCVVCLYL
jgi:hypothetical protein